MDKRYTVVLTQSANADMKQAGEYISENFMYEEYVVDFIDTIEKGIGNMGFFPYRLTKTGFIYRDYDIYMNTYKKYLFFLTINEKSNIVYILRILHQGMDWKNIIQRFIYYN